MKRFEPFDSICHSALTAALTQHRMAVLDAVFLQQATSYDYCMNGLLSGWQNGTLWQRAVTMRLVAQKN